MSDALHDTRGFNKDIINEAGEVDGALLAAKLRAGGGVTRDALINVQADAHSYQRSDSQVALLVSMLSSYYTQRYKELGLDKKMEGYNDGHISIDLMKYLAHEPELSDFRPDSVMNHAPVSYTHLTLPTICSV